MPYDRAMPKKFYVSYIIFTAILLLCMAAITVILLEGEADLEKSDSWIFRTHESIIEAERLNTLIARSVSSQRGYLITYDEKFLEEYQQRKTAIAGHLNRMAELTENNPSQQLRVETLREYSDVLADQLEVRAALNNMSSPTNRLTDVEIIKDLKTRIFETSEAFLEEEYSLLNRRIQALEEKKNNYYETLLVGGSLAVVVLMIFNGFLLRAQSRRSAAEKALDEKETVFRLAVEGAYDGVFDWNLVTHETFFSDQLIHMLGYTRDQFPASYDQLFDLIHPDEQEIAREYLELYLDGQLSDYSTTYRMQHKSGEWLWINVRAKAVFDKQHKPVRLVGAHTDVSASKLYELNLRNATKKAEAANEAKSDFLAHMSHEIRTPLTTISGVADILASSSESFSPKLQKLVNVLKSSSVSLRDLVTDILDFSKIESGELILEEREFSLVELFEHIISLSSPKALEKGLHFSLDYDDLDFDRVVGDSTRLRQIIINLVSNAIKFTSKGEVSVVARQFQTESSPILEISVKDTGVGIPESQLETIFERFKQADTSISRRFGGTGLGLTISRQLALLMGGTIEAKSPQRKGAEFILRVPLTPADQLNKQGHRDHIEKTALLNQLAGSLTETGKVLLVEDYEGNILVLSYILEAIGCRFDVARTGLEAISLWRENRYDAILMDIQMPKMDGYKATQEIRALEAELALPATPIIGMTAHALAEDKSRCLESGMDAYLPKPIVEKDLILTLQRFLQAA